MKAGWIGLGAMGWPMAGHLARLCHLAIVWNRSRDKALAFVEQHPEVTVAADPAALASQVDVIVTCVSADQDLEALVTMLKPALRTGQILLDHSTVSPGTAQRLAEDLGAMDVAFIDAPVTGGVEGAIKGQLAVMAGGSWAHFHQLAPLIDAYARIQHHLGPSGSGQSAKAVNQLMVAGIAEAVCEALALMESLDLPREAMLELLGGGAGGSWFLDKRGRSMLADEFEVGFDPRLLVKDLKICQALCEASGFHSSVVSQALADYQRLVEQGNHGRDISALIRQKRADNS